MKKIMVVIFFVIMAGLSGCSMHDDKGWEHTGEGKADSPSTPYVLEHKH